MAPRVDLAESVVGEPPLWTGKPAVQLFLARAWWRCSPGVVVLGLGLGWAVGALALQVGGGPLATHTREAYRLAGLAACAGLALFIPASLLAFFEHRWTSYAVTTSFAVIRSRRGLAVRTTFIPLNAVTEIRLDEYLGSRRYRLGTVALISPDQAIPGRFYAVRDPHEVARLVTRLLPQSRVMPSSSASTMSSM